MKYTAMLTIITKNKHVVKLKTICKLLYNLLTAFSPKASKTKPADELSIVYFNYFKMFIY